MRKGNFELCERVILNIFLKYKTYVLAVKTVLG